MGWVWVGLGRAVLGWAGRCGAGLGVGGAPASVASSSFTAFVLAGASSYGVYDTYRSFLGFQPRVHHGPLGAKKARWVASTLFYACPFSLGLRGLSPPQLTNTNPCAFRCAFWDLCPQASRQSEHASSHVTGRGRGENDECSRVSSQVPKE